MRFPHNLVPENVLRPDSCSVILSLPPKQNWFMIDPKLLLSDGILKLGEMITPISVSKCMIEADSTKFAYCHLLLISPTTPFKS